MLKELPRIIQGGMGIGVSTWPLASAVSRRGQLGVVSGTAISHIATKRLADGDPKGVMREAFEAFPFPEVISDILDRYFQPSGRSPDEPYTSHPMYSVRPSRFLQVLTVVSNFAEIHLAKRGHDGAVGLNLLEKIQMPTAASLYGAMLAGVDYVLMGAGIPTQIAGILDRLSGHEPVEYRLDAVDAGDQDLRLRFDPDDLFPDASRRAGPLARPAFVPIISSAVLGMALIRRSEGAVDGFVVEKPVAGGHNAPPRGKMKVSASGEPVYGEKDQVDLDRIAALGKPFWLAGGYGRPGGLETALQAGATGIQVGTAFSLCDESGIDPDLKKDILERVRTGQANIHTSATKSPTGFPFKIADVPGTMSDDDVYERRPRLCDVGLLRTVTVNESGRVEYRCPAEPVEDYVRKGGSAEDTIGRTCLCNNLLATVGMAKPRKDGYVEAPIVTSGDDLPLVKAFLSNGRTGYTADDVLATLLEGSVATAGVRQSHG